MTRGAGSSFTLAEIASAIAILAVLLGLVVLGVLRGRKRPVLYTLLSALALLFLFPFYWMINTAFKTIDQIHTWPLVGSMARRIQRPVVVLPQPLGPINPNILPRGISKVTSLTATSC